MKYMRVDIDFNYCGGGDAYYVCGERDFTEDEIVLYFDELAAELGMDYFGVMVGDFIDEGDEEAGLEELMAFISFEGTMDEVTQDELDLATVIRLEDVL